MTRTRSMHHTKASQSPGCGIRGGALDTKVVLAKQYEYPVAQRADVHCRPVAEGTA